MEKAPNRKIISVFEHKALYLGVQKNGVEFKADHLEAMARFLGKGPVPYFQLIHKGVRFSKYVGVIQVRDLTIEILPKADKASKEGDITVWKNVLLDMLRACRMLKVKSLSHASLQLRSHSILDLYIGIFLDEVEKLLHQGLVKRYRTESGNQKTWRGKMLFQKQVAHNAVLTRSVFLSSAKPTTKTTSSIRYCSKPFGYFPGLPCILYCSTG